MGPNDEKVFQLVNQTFPSILMAVFYILTRPFFTLALKRSMLALHMQFGPWDWHVSIPIIDL
jgi:hypothetical protein